MVYGDRGNEEGSGTISALAVIACTVMMCVVIAGAGSVYGHQTRLQAVADVAALAGGHRSAVAQWTGGGMNACTVASEVVERNGAHAGCEVRGDDTYVTVSQRVLVAGISVDIRAKARAGPVRRDTLKQ